MLLLDAMNNKLPQTPTRCGFVALVGRPNMGKSTLLNRLIGQKVAIASPVAQTTRHRIRGVLTEGNAQLILLDTPGFSKPLDALGNYLTDEGKAALKEADAYVLVFDITVVPGPGDAWVAQQVQEQAQATKKPVILVLNKVDRLAQNRPLQLERKKAYQALLNLPQVKETLMISAKTGKGQAQLQQALFNCLPQGQFLYEEDALTDQRLREMAAELIREQVLRHTHEELPHSVAVAMERFEETTPDGLPRDKVLIVATLYVDQTSQKGMVIGKGGHLVKTMGSAARYGLEKLLERPVFLELKVDVRKNWRKDEVFLKTLGLAPPTQ